MAIAKIKTDEERERMLTAKTLEERRKSYKVYKIVHTLI